MDSVSSWSLYEPLPRLEKVQIVIGHAGREREEKLRELCGKAVGYAVMWVTVRPGVMLSEEMRAASLGMRGQFHPQHWRRITGVMERERRMYWEMAPWWGDLDVDEFQAPFLTPERGLGGGTTADQWVLFATLIRGVTGRGGLCVCFDGLDLLSEKELAILDGCYEYILRNAPDVPLVLVGSAADIPYPLGARANIHYMEGYGPEYDLAFYQAAMEKWFSPEEQAIWDERERERDKTQESWNWGSDTNNQDDSPWGKHEPPDWGIRREELESPE